jgi:hypothetical protein
LLRGFYRDVIIRKENMQMIFHKQVFSNNIPVRESESLSF